MSLSRILYTILFCVASWSAYYLIDKEKTADIQVPPNSELPVFSGTNLDNVSYNESGVRSYVITSAHLDHYAKSGNTIFDTPVLKIYREGSKQEWEITAKRGILAKDNVLTLYDNVIVNNLLDESGFDKLTTARMSIHLRNRNFWTDNSVDINGPQFETNGQSMKGNFHDNSAVLYKHVQGRYETLTP